MVASDLIVCDYAVHVVKCCDECVLWRRCDLLCTSGFVDDVMFSRNGHNGASCVFLSVDRIRQALQTKLKPNFANDKEQALLIVCFERGRSRLSTIVLSMEI